MHQNWIARMFAPGSGVRVVAAALCLLTAEAQAKQSFDCNVVVIGAGAGGVHTAYQLAKLPKSNPNSKVCVFEKENRLGGRLKI